MSDQCFYVTTPIYYVNASPHIGHAYTSIAADVTARFNRLDGKRVFLLTGTDEHGQKVEKAAREANLPPQNYVDNVSAEFRATAELLDISFDDFIRTTEPRHGRACRAFWNRLVDAGQIYLGSYSGWYSVREESFVGEDEVHRQSDGRFFGPDGAAVEWVSEPSYFFRLSAWQQPLLDLYENQPDFVLPASKRNEVVSFVRSGLRDLSISRTSFSWGVQVPNDSNHIMYVWFDALINYISALGWPEAVNEPTSAWNSFWPAHLHLVGKEIARFHAVYWPALLMACDLPLPSRVFSHGWWTVDGQKMSKSAGNGVDPKDLVNDYGVDAVRFFLMREVPFGNDGDFSRYALVLRVNNELANDLGNLAQRTLALVVRDLDGRLPVTGEQTTDDKDILALATNLPDQVRDAVGRQMFQEALEHVWRVIRAANVYIDRQAPWRLAKQDAVRMANVLRVIIDVLRVVATVLQAFMPTTMPPLLDQLGVSAARRTIADLESSLVDGIQLPKPFPIFPRLAAVDQL